jgi:hypothetical protein
LDLMEVGIKITLNSGWGNAAPEPVLIKQMRNTNMIIALIPVEILPPQHTEANCDNQGNADDKRKGLAAIQVPKRVYHDGSCAVILS